MHTSYGAWFLFKNLYKTNLLGPVAMYFGCGNLLLPCIWIMKSPGKQRNLQTQKVGVYELDDSKPGNTKQFPPSNKETKKMGLMG